MDVNNTFDNQYTMALAQVQEVATRAHHKLASPETITMAIRMSTHRKVSFPGKFAPWSLMEMRRLDIPLTTLYKHHLKFMHSTPTALLHMDKEVGGLNIIRLSDQINIDKWAMMIRGLYSDSATAVATLGILNRCLRICLLYTSPSPRDLSTSRMPSSA